MASAASEIVRAECDGADRLVRAEEPLASLQLACGGELPGTVAVPELLALVRSARQTGRAQAGAIHAQDGRHAVSARVLVEPNNAGCVLSLSSWHASPLPDSVDNAAASPGWLDPILNFGSLLSRDLAERLRRPLGRIVTHAEAIRSRSAGALSDRYATYAGDIAAAGRHLLGLVDDLADLAAIEAGEFASYEEVIDLADLARRAAAMLSLVADERGMVIAAPGDAAYWAALGERRRVLQILLNLVGNALRYAPAGSTVRLEGARRDDRVALTVRDEGPGLEQAAQARIFDKFERLGRSGDGGSGLGLYISRRLARAMNGDLTVAGDPGKGTRFILELPAG